MRNWLHKYREAHCGADSELSVPERERLKQLEGKNQELRAETEFLKKAFLDSTVQLNGRAFSKWAVNEGVKYPGFNGDSVYGGFR